jgi:hypothetical protein
MIFLVVYDTHSGSLLEEVREFPEDRRAEAADALGAAQQQYIDRLNSIEIALFEGDSREMLEQTHSRYFNSLANLRASLNEATRPA